MKVQKLHKRPLLRPPKKQPVQIGLREEKRKRTEEAVRRGKNEKQRRKAFLVQTVELQPITSDSLAEDGGHVLYRVHVTSALHRSCKIDYVNYLNDQC